MNIMVCGNSKQKSEIPKPLLEALGACDRDSFPNIDPFPACCWLHIAFIKCRSKTIRLLIEKDQDKRKIGHDRRTLF